MDKRTWQTLLVSAAMVLVGSLGLQGLGCDVGAEKEEGPTLPPASSMTLDVSAFGAEQESAALDLGKADGAAGEKANFNAAALRVWWLNTAIAAHLVVPVALLGATVNSGAEFVDGTWVWELSLPYGKDFYDAKLTGWFESKEKDGVFLNLSMAVTCPTCKIPLDGYVWYTGEFNTDGGDGYWQFFSPEIAADDQSLVRIDYEIVDDTHRTLAFTNNREDGHETAGDIINYSLEGDSAAITVHDASAGLDYEVSWSVSTTAGSLTVPDYNNGAKACWDAAHLNSACQ